jgi:hypothetical protein
VKYWAGLHGSQDQGAIMVRDPLLILSKRTNVAYGFFINITINKMVINVKMAPLGPKDNLKRFHAQVVVGVGGYLCKVPRGA